MKKIILLNLIFVLAVFARTETIELTGEYSKQLGNPFKEALNIKKTKSINIYSEEKDIILTVDSNINTMNNFTSLSPQPDKFILKNKSVETVIKNFYNEDFFVHHSKKNSTIVNVKTGSIYLDYNNVEDNNGVYHLRSVEVTLVVSIIKNGLNLEKEIKMDHTLGKEEAYKGFLTSDDFDYSTLSALTTSTEILENLIYKALK